ncbi:MAG TPA: hypothetical protein PK325_07135 [Cyclobacteriaceae bacterium]|nr:hypothetical protein [Cyclobacteriaceae bacterium]HMV09413.1 hypothetical protein [Cyclobacteriaceae bacterium]HMX02434.1 hypothetical protein [Cyclobacteriaceae bacterium]HMX51078.1 hypothetical protein [Cyclobacteriaceae bacterium]HMY91740.1 hypothetical protein [Cyclobacteriaceae bacterium]
MANDSLTKVFLSASIPYPDRDRKFYDTADIISIRDAVRALATVVIPKAHLVWGGHPSITPLIRFIVERMNVNLRNHVTLYQSLFFEEYFPSDNFLFENIVLTERRGNREESLKLMRNKLIGENDFKVGIFIGGMEGINDEYLIFKEKHPSALILPIASTGAAASFLYESQPEIFDIRLKSDYAYMSLFRDLLDDLI